MLITLLKSRAFTIAFLGLFIPLVVPAFFLPVMKSLPEPLAVVVWLWATFFVGWNNPIHPAFLALIYTLLSLAFGLGAAWMAERAKPRSAK